MKALLLDTETTGLEPSQGASCIEVAVCLYDLKLAAPLASYASLIRGEAKNEAQSINGIPPKALPDAPIADVVWQNVLVLAAQADVVAAHRAEFDKKFVPYDLEVLQWVCTKTDFDWPGVGMGDHLVHLALAYGCGVVHAHRAMTDVDIMSRILTRVAELGHSLEELFAKAMRPKKKYVALVSYEQRELCKKAGFLWEPGVKQWMRSMPPEDAEKLEFRVREA